MSGRTGALFNFHDSGLVYSYGIIPRLGYSLRTTSRSRMFIPHFTMACITCFSHYLISTSSIPLFSPKAKCVISAFLPFSPTVVQKISSQSGQLDSQAVISILPSLDSPTLGPSRFGCFSFPCVYTLMLSPDSPHSDPLVTFYKASG